MTPGLYGPGDTLPDWRVEPPAETEIDPELTELVEDAATHRDLLESDGIKLSEADLLTPEEDEKWVDSFEVIDGLLFAATERMGKVSRERKEGGRC